MSTISLYHNSTFKRRQNNLFSIKINLISSKKKKMNYDFELLKVEEL